MLGCAPGLSLRTAYWEGVTVGRGTSSLSCFLQCSEGLSKKEQYIQRAVIGRVSTYEIEERRVTDFRSVSARCNNVWLLDIETVNVL